MRLIIIDTTINIACRQSSRQHLSYDDCLEDKRRLSELFCAVLCTTIVLSHMHTHISSSHRVKIPGVKNLRQKDIGPVGLGLGFCVCFCFFLN